MKPETVKVVTEMILWVRENKAHYNSFNKLVDEAADAHPDWMAALCEQGVAALLTTYCHD